MRGTLTGKLGWSESQAQLFVETMRDITELVKPDIVLNMVPHDEDDNRIIECAVAGEAALIVAYDKDLLRLKAYETISIITPRQLTSFGLAKE